MEARRAYATAMSKTIHPKPCGFTLVELLVVISIVVLLVGLLLPSLHRAGRQSRALACQSRLRQWAIYFDAYTSGNDGRFFGYTRWPRLMYDSYRDSNDVVLCPAATRLREPPIWYHSRHAIGGASHAWLWRGERPSRLSGGFGLNWWVQNVTEPPDLSELCFKGPLVSGAARVPVFGDCLAAGSVHDVSTQPPPTEDQWQPEISTSEHCINRHLGCVNVLFLDASIRKVGLRQLWTLKWHRKFDTTGPWTRAGGASPADWPSWMRSFRDD